MGTFTTLRLPGTQKEGNSKIVWSNEDLVPTPVERRTWRSYHYAAFQISGSFSGSGWTLGSALIASGLSWWQTLICLIAGEIICGVITVANGRAAAMYHVGYPVLVRSVWGMYASFWAVLTRAIVAVVWFGVQTYYGGVW